MAKGIRFMKKYDFIRLARDIAGQSTIEYLVVTSVVGAALITMPIMYKTFSDTMKNKYHSYTFGIAISDPPRKAFDDVIKKDADKVAHIFDVLEEIEDDIENASLPDFSDIHLPSWGDIEDFGDKLKEYF